MNKVAAHQIPTQQMIALLQQAIAAQPDNAENYLKLGLLLLQQGRDADAEKQLKLALSKNKNLFAAHFQLGTLYFRHYLQQITSQPLLESALKHYVRAQQIQPKAPQALEKLGIVYRFCGKLDQAIDCFERLLRIVPDNAGIHYRMGVVLSETDRHEEALQHFEKTLELDPNFIGAYASKAMKLERMNHLEDAWKTIEEGLRHAPDESSLLAVRGKLNARAKKYDEALADFNRALERPDNIRAQLETVYTEIAKIYDKQKRYAEAFGMFEKAQQGFAAMPQAATQRPEVIRKNYDNCLQWFTHERINKWSRPHYNDEITAPFYVVGFPRSGTTLTEQILSSHPRMTGTQEEPVIDNAIIKLSDTIGERITYPDILDALTEAHILKVRKSVHEELDKICGSQGQDKHIVDKMPLNIGNLGFIQRLFPEAKALVILRDPRDVVLSCFMQSFTNNMAMSNFFTLTDAANFYALTMRLYLHYKNVLSLSMMEVHYESLVSDIEVTTRRMLEFLGMEWHDDVLRYYEKDKNRHVTTPSYEGVMNPVYASSMGRWKNYAAQMESVLPILEPFVKQFGYESA